MALDNEVSAVTIRVAREIRAHREARGLSLQATADRAGLSKTIVATIESGAGNPSLETLCRIAQALDVTRGVQHLGRIAQPLAVTVGRLLAEDEPVRSRVIRRADAEWLSYESGIQG